MYQVLRDFRMAYAKAIAIMVLLSGASSAVYGAAENVEDATRWRPRKFTFSSQDERAAQSKRRSRQFLTAALKIRFPMDKQYHIVDDEEYVVSYLWRSTWEKFQKDLEKLIGLPAEQQFLYTPRYTLIDSMPAFYNYLKGVAQAKQVNPNVAEAFLFVYNERQRAKEQECRAQEDVWRESARGLLLQQPCSNEIPSDDDSKSDED